MGMEPLSQIDLDNSDEELGRWLAVTWLGYQAEKAGIPIDQIPEDWAASVVEASSQIDSENMKNAGLESAFRKAFSGEYESAGRMLRSYVLAGAHTQVLEKYAERGIAQTIGGRKGAEKSKAARRGAESKRAAILDAARNYTGPEAAKVRTIARKTGATAQYIRKVLGDKPA
ncbi:MAG: hypothetical protein K0M70_02930 [Arenimonas sp.]|uniref:hypothetical protein n=1 Tax=Arenimonas sp. TaxID=1872635 RepID=UPI0025C70A2A|nr:hypothetical protein [Arenimonas sp.]MBW8366796.1 hypothetical protein [Arenimonas sp.]